MPVWHRKGWRGSRETRAWWNSWGTSQQRLLFTSSFPAALIHHHWGYPTNFSIVVAEEQLPCLNWRNLLIFEDGGCLKACQQGYAASVPLGSVIRLHPNEFVANSIPVCSTAVSCWRYLCWLPRFCIQRHLWVCVTVSLFSFFFFLSFTPKRLWTDGFFLCAALYRYYSRESSQGAVGERINTLFLFWGLVSRYRGYLALGGLCPPAPGLGCSSALLKNSWGMAWVEVAQQRGILESLCVEWSMKADTKGLGKVSVPCRPLVAPSWRSGNGSERELGRDGREPAWAKGLPCLQKGLHKGIGKWCLAWWLNLKDQLPQASQRLSFGLQIHTFSACSLTQQTFEFSVSCIQDKTN